MIDSNKIRKILKDSSTCHCNDRQDLGSRTLVAIGKSDNKKRAYLKWWRRGTTFIVKFYTTEDNSDVSTYVKVNDTEEQAKAKIRELFEAVDSYFE